MKIGENVKSKIKDYLEILERINDFPIYMQLNSDQSVSIDTFSGKLSVMRKSGTYFVYDPGTDWIVFTEYGVSSNANAYHRKRLTNISQHENNPDIHFQLSLIEPQLPSLNELDRLKKVYKRLLVLTKLESMTKK